MKNIIKMFVALCAFVSIGFGQIEEPESTAPQSVPFGQEALISAIASVDKYKAKVYTIEDGQMIVLQQIEVPLPAFSSLDELGQEIGTHLFDFVVNPGKEVYIKANLCMEDEDVFQAFNSFYLEIFRDDDGKPIEYEVPEYVQSLYFSLLDSFVQLDGVVKAEMVGEGKVWELDVDPGGFVLPGYRVNNDSYHTLRLTFSNGEVVEYDRMGQRVVSAQAGANVNNVNIGGIEREQVDDGEFEYNDADPWNNWNPLIELYNEEGGWVSFEIQAGDRWWQRPTHVWIYTLDEYRAGLGATVFQDDPGWEVNWYSERPQIYLQGDTHYIIMLEWGDETQINTYSYFYGGGKG